LAPEDDGGGETCGGGELAGSAWPKRRRRSRARRGGGRVREAAGLGHAARPPFIGAGARPGRVAHAKAEAWRRRPGLPCLVVRRKMTGVARLSATASREGGVGRIWAKMLVGCGHWGGCGGLAKRPGSTGRLKRMGWPN
jgi:hypothetical protein